MSDYLHSASIVDEITHLEAYKKDIQMYIAKCIELCNQVFDRSKKKTSLLIGFDKGSGSPSVSVLQLAITETDVLT